MAGYKGKNPPSKLKKGRNKKLKILPLSVYLNSRYKIKRFKLLVGQEVKFIMGKLGVTFGKTGEQTWEFKGPIDHEEVIYRDEPLNKQFCFT